MNLDKTKNGEPRRRAPGAGRKPLPESEKLHRHTVRMDDERWQHCLDQGDASEYIRGLIDRDRKRRKK